MPSGLAGLPDRRSFPGAGGKSSLTIPDKLLLWMQLFNEK